MALHGATFRNKLVPRFISSTSTTAVVCPFTRHATNFICDYRTYVSTVVRKFFIQSKTRSSLNGKLCNSSPPLSEAITNRGRSPRQQFDLRTKGGKGERRGSWCSGGWFLASPLVLGTSWIQQPTSTNQSLLTATEYLNDKSDQYQFMQFDYGNTSKVLFFAGIFGMMMAGRLGKAHLFSFFSKYNPSFLCIIHPSFMHLMPRNAGAVKKS
eukprot:GHVQ01008747.1.p2 GENE.GHVQ01008747.1~~GHVQ01008747.1.p2  ORF type:complete len:211 (+),score=19.98 GHVQ01008747.1:2255-2887(+)